MKKNIKLILIIAIIFSIVLFYLVFSYLAKPSPPSEDIRFCVSAEDCVPVSCGCSCSGCGGFSYEDIVNKKYVGFWYNQKKCKPAEICPMTCCPPRKVSCENNRCVVING